MKKRIIFGLSTSAILTISLISVAATLQIEKASKAKGYSGDALPTTINLNDTNTSTIRSYYSALNNLSSSQRQGNNLLKNLKTILKNGQKYYNYDSGNLVWQMYEITDRDWEKSPASSTVYGTYNSSTNTITNYSYGTSNTNGKNNPYLRAYYVNRNVENEVQAWGNHQQNQWGINREHLWAKAEGFDDDSNAAAGARGDPFHLVAANGYANNIHSNHFYGYVNTSSTYTDCGTKYSNLSGNLSGDSLTLGGTTAVFEPQDCDKGDIARAIFYMAARYNYFSGSDSDGIDADNPNLILSQSLSDWRSSGYTSTTSNPGKMGILTDLLAWHHADPVDEYEKHRNNLLYTNFTNNRNPFIDFPEWADFIWGTATYNGKNYQSYNSNPTGYANPSSDTIYGYNGSSTDPTVNYVSVNPSSLSLDIKNGQASGNSSATVSVSNAAPTTVNWTISPANQGVTISANGNNVTVTAAANATIGNYTVTATSTYDNTKSGECIVTVLNSSQGGGGETSNFSDSVTAASGALEGFTGVGTGTAYADGSVKLDSAGDYIYSTTLFTGDISANMQTLSVVINAKMNGAPTEDNSYRVDAIDSSGNVLASVTKTGADVFTTSYGEQSFAFSSGLAGCAGIKITYVTKGGGNLGIKSVSWSGTYSEEQQVPTMITATVNKTFSVGETITKSDITLEDDLGNVITDYDFDNYQFTYNDAASGGEETEKDFDIEYEGLETTLSVLVKREEHVYTTDTLNRDLLGIDSTSYVNWTTSDVTTAEYAGNSSTKYTPTGKDEVLSIQIKNDSTKGSGVVATKSAGLVDRVSIVWHSNNYSGRTLNIYGKNTAYEGTSDLYTSSSTQGTLLGTIVCGTSDSLTINGDYEYIGILSASGTAYLSEIKIFYHSNAENVANFIMFEDTTNQCVTKTDDAIDFFEELNATERERFMEENNYVLSTARERFNAWLRNQGKEVVFSGGEYVVESNVLLTDILTFTSTNHTTIIIISSIACAALAVTAYIVFKKKKEE